MLRCIVLVLCSNAGKFTTTGVVTVDVAIVTAPFGSTRGMASPASSLVTPEPAQYLVVTVSNPRRGHVIPDTEALFVPFKGQFDRQATSVAGGLLFGPLLSSMHIHEWVGGS